MTRVGANLLEHVPAAADEDTLLRITLDIDRRCDVDTAVFALIVLLDDDGDRVRHLLLEVEQHLLADQLGDDFAFLLIGDLFGRIVQRPFRYMCNNLVE
jgi:hypothetical protein